MCCIFISIYEIQTLHRVVWYKKQHFLRKITFSYMHGLGYLSILREYQTKKLDYLYLLWVRSCLFLLNFVFYTIIRICINSLSAHFLTNVPPPPQKRGYLSQRRLCLS